MSTDRGIRLFLSILLACLSWGIHGLARGQADAGASTALTRPLIEQARALESGDGAPQALSLYCEAARLGDAEALYSLGWMYANGRGTEVRASYAATLFAMAAERGIEAAHNAQRLVGESSGQLPPCMSAAAPRQVAAPAASAPPAEDDYDPAVADLDGYLAALPPDKRRIAELIRLLAPQYGIHARLALAVAVTESNFDALARSPRGAEGVMQLIPDTARRFGVKRILEPGQNIRGGLAYLRWLLAYYQGDVLLSVAAYNAGEGAVDRFRGIPPFMETVAYVKRIRRIYTPSQHPYQAGLVEPSPLVSRRVAGR